VFCAFPSPLLIPENGGGGTMLPSGDEKAMPERWEALCFLLRVKEG